MNKTVETEEKRKELLFAAWNDFTKAVNKRLEEFDQIFEGSAVVTHAIAINLELKLEDGREIPVVPITPYMWKHTCVGDYLGVVLGLQDGRWWPLAILTVGSQISDKKDQMHFSTNPSFIREAWRVKNIKNECLCFFRSGEQ